MFFRLSKLLFFLLCFSFIFPSVSLPESDPSIKLAAIFALTGKAAQSNKPAILGTKLAVREINQEGGLLGQQLELMILDNKSSPIGSHVAAELAVRSRVKAIIGSVWSSHSLTIAKVAEKNNIPMISPNSTVPSLTAIGDHIFRVCYDDTFQGKVIADFAFHDLEARKALIFIDLASDFSLTLADIFSRTFREHGGQIVGEIDYKAGDTSYLPQARRALSYDADIAFLSGHDESGIIAKELEQAGFKGIPVGSDSWDVESFFLAGGNRIKRGYFINHWNPTQREAPSRTFLKKYGDQVDINAATALAYDAVHVLAAAIKTAKSTDDRAIIKALHNLQGFNGVTGDITFNSQGNARKQACIMEIRNGISSYLRCQKAEK